MGGNHKRDWKTDGGQRVVNATTSYDRTLSCTITRRHTYPSFVGEPMNLARVVSCQQRLGERIFPSSFSKTLSFLSPLPLADMVGDPANNNNNNNSSAYTSHTCRRISSSTSPQTYTLHMHNKRIYRLTYTPWTYPSYFFLETPISLGYSAMRAVRRLKLSAFSVSCTFRHPTRCELTHGHSPRSTIEGLEKRRMGVRKRG